MDATILETGGFGIFKDEELSNLLRHLAQTQDLIILTDSNGAGLLIRGRLKGILDPALVKHAYIPDVYGKKRRKRMPGKEGKVGVEGMPPQVLLEALRQAGATFSEQESEPAPVLMPADLYALGLTGRPNSARLRSKLQQLQLPEHLSDSALGKLLQKRNWSRCWPN